MQSDTEYSVSTALAPVQQDVLAIDDDTPIEVLAMLIERVEAAKRFAKELDGFLKDKLIERIKERGPIVLGDTLYRFAAKKLPPKCRDQRATFEALIAAEGGDLAAVCEKYLGAGAIKYGAAKAMLGPERYAELFIDGVYEDDLKKELIKTDTKFIR